MRGLKLIAILGAMTSILGSTVMLQEALAAPACRTIDGFGDPLLLEPLRHGKARGLAEFRLHVECDAGSQGTWALEFKNKASGDFQSLRPINRSNKPKSLKPSRRRFELEIYDKTLFCRNLETPSKKTAVTGPAGRRITTFETEVQVRLIGTGALADLSRVYSGRARCPACTGLGTRGSLYVRIPQRMTNSVRGPHLEARLEPRWFDCVRPSSTLHLRLFDGDTRAQALNALRPYAIIDGLERPLTAKGRDTAVRIPLDAPTICRRTGRWVAYELWGEGELHRAGGGGRGAVQIKCP